MFLEVILVLLGFFLLIKGADYLVDGASDIAKKFKIPEMDIIKYDPTMKDTIIYEKNVYKDYPNSTKKSRSERMFEKYCNDNTEKILDGIDSEYFIYEPDYDDYDD